ncbi:DsbA family protein [Streptomyces sp. NPDC007088]|uniref:DsbA family protein n=1 Tax=Streptomyces sp. NPDC007088 TaxID=3364773 RepID=UPI0036AE5CCE
MSEKNRQGKLSARERIAADRRQEQVREKRRKTVVVAVSVAAVLGVAGAIGAVAANLNGDKADAAGPVVTPKGAAGEDGLAIPVGKESAKSTLTIWEDFRCPACAQFEGAYRSTIHELAGKGQLKVEYHLATLIDKNMGGSGSARAANAAVCAQDAGKFPEYHDELYRNQPAETEDTFAEPDKLLGLAKKVDGLDTPAFRSCVEKGTHDAWVAKSDEKFQQGNFRGTPTVRFNGKDVFSDQKNPLTPAKLKKLAEDAARG